jgi:hypothetical protein
MVEADIHLRPLHTSKLDRYKVFEPLLCCLTKVGAALENSPPQKKTPLSSTYAKKEQTKPYDTYHPHPPNRRFLNSTHQAEIDGGGNILQ